MYMIEISEDKVDHLMEHITKSIKCLGKVVECLEEIKEGDGYEMDDDNDEYEAPVRRRYAEGGRSMYRNGGRSRSARGGRYSNY